MLRRSCVSIASPLPPHCEALLTICPVLAPACAQVLLGSPILPLPMNGVVVAEPTEADVLGVDESGQAATTADGTASNAFDTSRWLL